MTRQLTITIADDIYQKAQTLAQSRQVGIHELIETHVAQTLPVLPFVPTRDPLVEREREAYVSLHPVLLDKHADEYVAIYQGQLVDHDSDKLALFERIDVRFPEEFVLIRKVEAEPEKVYTFHSTRFSTDT